MPNKQPYGGKYAINNKQFLGHFTTTRLFPHNICLAGVKISDVSMFSKNPEEKHTQTQCHTDTKSFSSPKKRTQIVSFWTLILAVTT